MHYVKQFSINGVDTKQVACIELQGKPNAATEGYVGVLGIDMISPLHEVYKCVAVNGSIFTWELLSSGMSTLTSTTTGNGEESFLFPYSEMKIPSGYLIKNGDLIIDSEGYLYQISSIGVDSCSATYCGTQFLKGNQGDPGISPTVGDNGNWWIGDIDTGTPACPTLNIEFGSYVGTGTSGVNNPNVIPTSFPAKAIIISNSGLESGPVILINPQDSFHVHSDRGSSIYNGTNIVSWGEDNVSWYCHWYQEGYYGEAMYQLNTSSTYYYAVIGEQYGMESINAALDNILAIQSSLMGGDGV